NGVAAIGLVALGGDVRRTGNDTRMTHQELIDSAAAYALGALDDDERTLFEGHLPGCSACREEVESYREVAGLLVHAAPVAAASNHAALRDRILRDARQVRPIANAPSARSTPSRSPRVVGIA